MPFQKGHIKTGGKVKGTPNKDTSEIKLAFKQLIENNLDNLTAWLEQVAEDNPDKALKIIHDLAEYVLPKLARTDLTSSDDSMKPQVNINVTSKDSAKKVKDFMDGSKPE
jgi:hypothetical protein